jgi:hypothetical protein
VQQLYHCSIRELTMGDSITTWQKIWLFRQSELNGDFFGAGFQQLINFAFVSENNINNIYCVSLPSGDINEPVPNKLIKNGNCCQRNTINR